MIFNMDEEIPKQPEESQTNIESEPVKEKEEEIKKHIRMCPYCKQEYKTKIGASNWKNLFRKPTLDDWITLVILILLFLAAYAYIQETSQCKYMLTNLDQTCMKYDAMKLNLTTRSEVDALPPLLTINQSYQEYLNNSTNESDVNNYVPYEPNQANNESNSSGNVIGGEKDEHGCIIPAGYSWCESLQECIRPWEKNCTGAVASSKVKVNVTTMSNSTNASIKP
jgi:hypothetical protein